MVSLMFAAAMACYLVATVLFAHRLLRPAGVVGRAAWTVGAVALGTHALALGELVFTGGLAALVARPALPAAGCLLAASVCALVFRRDRYGVAGAFACSVATVVLLVTLIASDAGAAPAATATRPDASSPVAIIHISASILGFLCLAAAFVLAGLFVLQEVRVRSRTMAPAGRFRLPPLQTLETSMYRALYVGFALYSLGAALGTLWALQMPGSGGFKVHYPFAVLSWGIFAVVATLRVVTGWSGRRAALLVALGFNAVLAVVLFYYFRLG